jgi:nucleoside phosphorylase
MPRRFSLQRSAFSVMNLLWLGYDGLAVPYNDVVAVLLYQPALDARIVHTYGHVPPGIRAVVVVTGDRYWPSRWEAEWLRRRLVEWRGTAPPS